MAKNKLGAAIAEALSQVGALYRATVELAKAQLSKEGSRLGLGLALIVAALVAVAGVTPLLVLAFVWGLIALGIWPWAAYLIAAGVALVAAAGLAVAGRALLKKASAAIGQTTDMIKASLDALKGEPAGEPVGEADPSARPEPPIDPAAGVGGDSPGGATEA
ncbi:MAG: phage holin family protein [Bifidobacteriaceae bacterium]|nr:phage holin family protein [Bifidobacteriaceae bacterium]